jgi:phenylacetate-coenzyme A ligase PaaK-like adenylate-forming protein
MFSTKSLKKVSHLLQVFYKKDRRYRMRLRSWEDFKEIPISGREELKAILGSGLVRDAFNITATSGSTSSRMIITHSREAHEAHQRRLVKLYQLIGVKKGMVCLNLCSYELNSGGRLMEAAFKAAGAGVIPFGPISTPEKVLEAAQLIKMLKPQLVNAYTNQLFDLFAVLGRKHSIRRCLVNGEPLWPEYRKRIERMGGVHVYDHYGAMEISGLAVALKPDDEYMRVVADGLLLEVLEGSGKASATGVGALLVTDLENVSMPFIRYRLGDRVELIRRWGALWIKVLSRTEDSLLINGVVILKKELIRTVNDFVGHPGFFFVIDKHQIQYYDKLLINVTDGKPQQFKALTQAVVKAVGMDRCIEVRTHQGTIPRTINGKIKYFFDARKAKAKAKA